MKDLINGAIEDIRVFLFIIFMIMILGAFFAGIKESTDNEQTKEMVDKVEQSTIDSFTIIIWGIGIIGTIGTLVMIFSFLRDQGII
jgi:hypothetical protein